MKLVSVPVIDSKTECTINADQILMLYPDEKQGREVTRIIFPSDHVVLVDWTYAQTIYHLAHGSR